MRMGCSGLIDWSLCHQGPLEPEKRGFWLKGIRLEELNVLLKQTVMIRRLKDHVLMQLPPIRRQIINLVLKKSDIDFAKEVCRMVNDDASTENEVEDALSDEPNKHDGENDDDCCNSPRPSNQVISIAKLAGFKEWLLLHPIIAESDDDEKFDSSQSSHKMIIFVHYHKVADRLQEFLCEKGIKFVRIDGRDASARDRQQAISSFQHSKDACKVPFWYIRLNNILRLEGMVWMGLEGMSRHIGAT
ncbi:putative P-loop containing nucleoside triphosphate hydrolase [Helianthus debilis subsp. tardiflorus]